MNNLLTSGNTTSPTGITWNERYVSTSHLRYSKDLKHVTPKRWYQYDSRWIAPRGGMTIVTIVNDTGIHIGVAVCSKNDGYNKSVGRKIAYGRAALAALNNKLIVAPDVFYHLPKHVMAEIMESVMYDSSRELVNHIRGEK